MDREYRALYPFIGREIKNIRKYNHITQEELSKISGVNKDTIRKIENGYVDANIVTLILILEALGVSINYVSETFLNQKGTMYSNINNIYKGIEESLLIFDYKNIEALLSKLEELDYSFLPYSTYKEIESKNLLYKSFVEDSLYRDFDKSLELLFESMRVSYKNFDLGKLESQRYNGIQTRTLMNIASTYNKYDIEKSFEIYTHLINSNYNLEEKNQLLYNLINSKYLIGDYKEALKLSTKLLKSIGNNDTRLHILALFQKGLLLEKMDRIDSSIIYLKSAINLSLITSNSNLTNKMKIIVDRLI